MGKKREIIRRPNRNIKKHTGHLSEGREKKKKQTKTKTKNSQKGMQKRKQKKEISQKAMKIN